MARNRYNLLNRAFSAIFLTGVVLVSVLVSQPKAADKPIPQKEKKVAVQPVSYTPRTNNVSSRADKPTKPSADFIYTVKQGDTLYDLALTYGVSVEQIVAANGLASEKLSLDQKLLIPVSGKVRVAKVAAAKPVIPRKVIAARPVVAARTAAATTRYAGRAIGSLINWSKVQNIFNIGEVATVIDVNTGYTFKIKRKGGHNHADCEPFTASDSAVIKRLYGGSWSWDRRAIVVVVDGQNIAASMAGMPHGSETISDNKFSGHFDVHFYGSKTHGSEYTHSHTPMVDPDHQAMVRKAAGR
ncbi:MAG: LysM peptidoglycan-binding domain-containing protein [Eubacteriales bacterium]